jgi:hypothetical protein
MRSRRQASHSARSRAVITGAPGCHSPTKREAPWVSACGSAPPACVLPQYRTQPTLYPQSRALHRCYERSPGRRGSPPFSDIRDRRNLPIHGVFPRVRAYCSKNSGAAGPSTKFSPAPCSSPIVPERPTSNARVVADPFRMSSTVIRPSASSASVQARNAASRARRHRMPQKR